MRRSVGQVARQQLFVRANSCCVGAQYCKRNVMEKFEATMRTKCQRLVNTVILREHVLFFSS